MAKGNLFLGMGRGSVGDVTFYRADGQQLSRARNRKPRNPKSNAQLIQRAISATIVQAYKAGSIIFDHSFEGKSVPAGSQRAFLSTNMRKLREQVLREMNLEASSQLASVVSPRAVYPVPNAYRISEGSLIQNLFVQGFDDDQNPAAVPVQATEGETISAYLTRLNVVPGEIFTVVSLGVLTSEDNRNSLLSPQCTFGFMRLTVKETAATSTKTMATATYQDIFDIDSAGAVLPTARLFSEGIFISDLDRCDGDLVGIEWLLPVNGVDAWRGDPDQVVAGAYARVCHGSRPCVFRLRAGRRHPLRRVGLQAPSRSWLAVGVPRAGCVPRRRPCGIPCLCANFAVADRSARICGGRSCSRPHRG